MYILHDRKYHMEFAKDHLFGLLLFNVDLCAISLSLSLFVILKQYQYYIRSYADDNTPYVSGRNIEEVVTSLENVSDAILIRLKENQFQGKTKRRANVMLY